MAKLYYVGSSMSTQEIMIVFFLEQTRGRPVNGAVVDRIGALRRLPHSGNVERGTRWSKTSGRGASHIPRKPLKERPLQLGRKSQIRTSKSESRPNLKIGPFSTRSMGDAFLQSECQRGVSLRAKRASPVSYPLSPASRLLYYSVN